MAGVLKNCGKCGRLYMDMGRHMCEKCYELELKDEEVAAEFVRENPNATLKQIVEGTGIKEKIIMRMIRQGRFLATSGVTISYPCSHCGKMITQGRLCDSCNRALITEVVQQQQRQERLKKLKRETQKVEPAREVSFAKKKPVEKGEKGGMYSKDMGLR